MSNQEIHYTNLRDAVMDKYWMQYIRSTNGYYSAAKTEYSDFWFWFYHNIYGTAQGLEAYL